MLSVLLLFTLGSLVAAESQELLQSCADGQENVILTSSIYLSQDNLTLGINVHLFNEGLTSVDLRGAAITLPFSLMQFTNAESPLVSDVVQPSLLTFTCNPFGTILEGTLTKDVFADSFLQGKTPCWTFPI